MKLRFFYKGNSPSKNHEVIITSFAILVSKVIALPPIIDVCLYDLGENVYGGLDRYRINKIAINYDLDFDSIPKILTHELIHVHQSHTGKLKIDRNGTFYWHGIPYTSKMVEDMSYDEYKQLPWEVDVDMNLNRIMSEALSKLDK